MGVLVDSGIAWAEYNRQINGWILGDDRQWIGSFPVAFLLAGDTGLAAAYLTIKSNPLLEDSEALLQILVTTSTNIGNPGQIVNSGGNVNVTIRVTGEDVIDGGIAPGPYYYDIRGMAQPSQAVWTFETGQIEFVQNVTDQESGGMPAALPNAGNPRFRGFICGGPPTIGIYNKGDWVRNSCPVPGSPSGWVCLYGGADLDATWVSDGIVGNTTGA